jgi:hypothetical protein
MRPGVGTATADQSVCKWPEPRYHGGMNRPARARGEIL